MVGLSSACLPRIRLWSHKVLQPCLDYSYPGSQTPFWGEEVTSPAIVGLLGFAILLKAWVDCSRNIFGTMVKLHIVSCCLSCLHITNIFKIYEHILCASDHKLLNFLVLSNARNHRLRSNLIIMFNSYFCSCSFSIYDVELPHPLT